MKKITLSFLPAAAWLLLSTFLLVIPAKKFPQENWFDKIWLDKWVHIGIFSVLVFLCCYASLLLSKNKQKLKRIFLYFALFSLVYGIAMEFIQKHFVPNRSFDAGDIVADAVGCAAGYLFCTYRYIKK